jgi:hypothetical protein
MGVDGMGTLRGGIIFVLKRKEPESFFGEFFTGLIDYSKGVLMQ